MTTPLTIQLSWPAPQLGSNASLHHMVRHRYRKAARTEAGWATKAALGQNHAWAPAGERVKIDVICHPPKGSVHPDDDGMVYRVKGHQDGIADALNVNDNTFEAPTITWADKC